MFQVLIFAFIFIIFECGSRFLIFFLIKNFFQRKQTSFMMLCWFHHTTTEPAVNAHISHPSGSASALPRLGRHGSPGCLPRVMRQLPSKRASSCGNVPILVLLSQSVPPCPPPPLTTSPLSLWVSIPALLMGSSTHLSRFPYISICDICFSEFILYKRL